MKHSYLLSRSLLIVLVTGFLSFSGQARQRTETADLAIVETGLSIGWSSSIGRNYIVEYSASLAPDSWIEIATRPGVDGRSSFTDTNIDRIGQGSGFYRVQVSTPTFPPGGGTGVSIDSLEPRFASMFRNIGPTFTRAATAWKGFVPNEHPIVLAVKDDSGKIIGAYAINHPKPEALGDATKIDITGLPILSAHRIANPVDATRLKAIDTFAFAITLGDVDSFAMVAGGTDAFFDPAKKDYVSTLLHEMFHRYQFQKFQDDGAGQDTEGYAFTADNLETAFLEERALRAAVEATEASAREVAARHFAALRVSRLAADSRVKLDNGQERGEGVARYLEHLLAGDDPGFNYNTTNFEDDLHRGIETVADVKESFSFGRFYASGAAVFHLIDDFGIQNVEARIEAGESPAELLIDHLGITESNATPLVAEARSIYDPKGELPAVAATASKAIADGGTPVTPPTDGNGGTDGNPGGDTGSDLSAKEHQCLIDMGVDLSADNLELTAEQATCLKL